MYNGALLSSEVPIEKFDKPHQSKPFNPIIASVFYKAGFIENWGKGTLNIIDECIKYGLPTPTYEYEWTAVRTTFYKANLIQKENEGINEGIILLYKHIQKYPFQRISQITHLLNKGSKKTGGYCVKN